NEDPIGRMLVTFDDDRHERIVGIAANVAEETLTDGPVPARYMLYEHVPMLLPAATFVVAGHAADDVPRLMEATRQAVLRNGRLLAVERTLSMASVFEDAVGAPGRIVTLLSLLAGLALVLGAVGVYGMISHFVARRSRDYGIRLALGLPPARVVTQVLGRGLKLVGLGSVLGIAGALVFTRLLSSLLFGVQATDPQALAGAVVALAVAGTLAALVPARRASRTDPVTVLREQ
ncbi:MAG: FtsX-like permease family protein, partial [Acidobacteria bacterium]